jgi:hypothetical protein
VSADPLLKPYRLKHLTLGNRIIITAREPAYPEDGMPKDLYRAYHIERAKGGGRLDDDCGLGGGVAQQLFRIGDAVAARNTHAAIYDALRLVKDL